MTPSLSSIPDSHNFSLLYTACDIKKTIASVYGKEYHIENDKLKVRNESKEKINHIVLEFIFTEQIPSKISTPYGALHFYDVRSEKAHSKELVQNLHNTFVASAKSFIAIDNSPMDRSWIITEWKGQKLEPFIPLRHPISQHSANESFSQMLKYAPYLI